MLDQNDDLNNQPYALSLLNESNKENDQPQELVSLILLFNFILYSLFLDFNLTFFFAANIKETQNMYSYCWLIKLCLIYLLL